MLLLRERCCMRETIALCGINCAECKAFIATQKDDDSLRRETAAEWSKQFGHEVKPEEINCNGCPNLDGRHIDYCSNICEIRKCGIAKKVVNCAYCLDYKCDKLATFHENAPNAKSKLEEIRNQRG
jgi:hypothetical protein